MPSWRAPLAGPGLTLDLAQVIDLSLPIRFDADASRAFDLPPARAHAVLDAHAASCNCATYTITPHGDGTHTEGVGHLLEDAVPVIELLHAPLLPALLVAVAPTRLDEVQDEVTGNHAPDDRVVDELSLREAIDAASARIPPGFVPEALVVRATPASSRFSGTNPPYFTIEAIELVLARGFQHLLTDLPSLDREDDGGLLGAHRAFFALAPRQSTSTRRRRAAPSPSCAASPRLWRRGRMRCRCSWRRSSPMPCRRARCCSRSSSPSRAG